jgi:hypothetical protein
MMMGGKKMTPYAQLLLVAKDNERRGLPPPEELTTHYAREFPEDLYAWYCDFVEISQQRTSNENGPNPINWTDIKAWADLRGETPSDYKIEVILTLDRLLRSVYKKQNQSKVAPP